MLANSPDDEISNSATRLRDEVNAAVLMTSDEEFGKLTDMAVENIVESVQVPTSENLSIEYLAGKASSLISGAPKGQASDLIERLLFTEEQWETALRPFLNTQINPSLAITNPLGGCIFLVDNSSSEKIESTWDTYGYSTLLRMAMFSAKLIEELSSASIPISSKTKTALLYYILLVQQLAKDNLSVAHANNLWKEYSPDIDADVLEFTSNTQQWVVSTLGSDKLRHEFAPALVERLLERSSGSSSTAFYTARVLCVVISDLCEDDQFFRDMAVKWVNENEVWKNKSVFTSAAVLTGSASFLSHTKKEKVWTGIVGSLLGVSATKAATAGLQQLVLLNSALPAADEDAASVPQPRAMNLIKHLLSWLAAENKEIDLGAGLIVEISKTLCKILPIVKGMYGSHWQSTFDFMKGVWEVCRHM